MSTFAEVFDPDDPVARFVVAMCMARNDVSHALVQAKQAGAHDSPKYPYWVLIATGHFFEAELALREWQKVPEVKGFVAKLPPDAQKERRKVLSAIQKLGQRVLEHSRDRTFHYPYPASRYQTDEELRSALDALGKEEVMVVSEGEGLLRLHFADVVSIRLALGKYDRSSLRSQAEIAANGAYGFVNFATRAWETYARKHDLEIVAT